MSNELKHLSGEQRRTVGEAALLLEDLSADERPLATIARSLRALAPNAQGLALDWSNSGGRNQIALSDVPQLQHLSELPGAQRLISKLASYRRDGRDRTQHRALDFLSAAGGNRDAMELFQKEAYEPYGMRNQLRVLVGEPGQGSLLCCLLLPQPYGADVRSELARLQALVPALRSTVMAYRALNAELDTIAAAALAIDAFDEPAWLCSERGRVLHRNEAALHVGDSTPACVLAAARKPAAAPACVRAKRIQLNDRRVVLVLLAPLAEAVSRAQPVAVSGSSELELLLPPALRPIAAQVALGRTDAQIAAELQRPLATVRTYVARLYRRLGVRSRAELVNLTRSSGSRR